MRVRRILILILFSATRCKVVKMMTSSAKPSIAALLHIPRICLRQQIFSFITTVLSHTMISPLDI